MAVSCSVGSRVSSLYGHSVSVGLSVGTAHPLAVLVYDHVVRMIRCHRVEVVYVLDISVRQDDEVSALVAGGLQDMFYLRMRHDMLYVMPFGMRRQRQHWFRVPLWLN